MTRIPANRIVLASAVALLIAAASVALLIRGSSAAASTRRADASRTAALRQVSAAVEGYWAQHGRLPLALSELADQGGAELPCRDPVTGRPYEVRVTSGRTYELCAWFSRPSPPGNDGPWAHASGRCCFTREVGVAPGPGGRGGTRGTRSGDALAPR